MATHESIFEIRDRYLNRYQDYLTTLSGSLVESLSDTTLPPAARHERSQILSNRFFGAFVQSIQPIRDDLQRLVGVSDDPLILSFVSELSQDVIAGLSDIARREAKSVSRLALEVLMGLSNPFSNAPESTLSLLERRMRVMDSSGRRWRSERYVAILIQSTLFRAANESTLYRSPRSCFVVRYADPNKPELMLSLDDYRRQEIQDEIFHPNSSALVIEIT